MHNRSCAHYPIKIPRIHTQHAIIVCFPQTNVCGKWQQTIQSSSGLLNGHKTLIYRDNATCDAARIHQDCRECSETEHPRKSQLQKACIDFWRVEIVRQTLYTQHQHWTCQVKVGYKMQAPDNIRFGNRDKENGLIEKIPHCQRSTSIIHGNILLTFKLRVCAFTTYCLLQTCVDLITEQPS